MVFVGNRPTNEELGEAYGTLDHQQYYAEIRETNAAKMRECVLELAQIVSSDAKILDVGCGNGEFLLLLKANGFRHLAGHEIPGADLSALTRAGIRIWQDYDYETLPDNSFDCVTMLDVAEHVPSPRHLFDNCLRILRPAGLLYVHTPGVSMLDRVMHHLGPVGRKWQRSRTSIFHLQNYSQTSVRLLLREFADVRCRQVNELTWPLSRYVRVYLRPPRALAPILTAALWPFLCTSVNANKVIVVARKAAA